MRSLGFDTSNVEREMNLKDTIEFQILPKRCPLPTTSLQRVARHRGEIPSHRTDLPWPHADPTSPSNPTLLLRVNDEARTGRSRGLDTDPGVSTATLSSDCCAFALRRSVGTAPHVHPDEAEGVPRTRRDSPTGLVRARQLRTHASDLSRSRHLISWSNPRKVLLTWLARGMRYCRVWIEDWVEGRAWRVWGIATGDVMMNEAC